jgi:4-amino-4-deoxy-L-arabinose transferase-like glycosyltransferase
MTTTLDRIDGDRLTSAASPFVPAKRRRLAGIVRGKPTDPAWVRPCLLALLTITAAFYLWDLGASGWGNSFYSAAVQAGTKSWKAFFFGSFDSSNFITVDKPPAALWVMELSARIFGLNSWSILVPQALEGVATVGLIYATVRRWFSPAAALIAGGVVALTPVAALMFRYNNPDALLVLLLTASAYATVRAIEGAGARWLVLAGALTGFGFITKMLQAFLLVPAIGIAYLIAADTRLRRRILNLVYGGIALIVSSGWWVAAVQLTPASDRPYIGGSQDNSELGLIFGYNGFGRITGNESGSVVPGGTGGTAAAGVGAATPGGGATTSPWGPTGIGRLFTDTFGGDISWLLPAALMFFFGGLWFTRRAPRTDRTRAALIIFGGWTIITGLVFSFAKGIIHPYYTVALAPSIAGLIGVGGFVLWKNRASALAKGLLSLATAVTAIWSFVLLDRSPSWLPFLRWTVLSVGIGAAVLMALGIFPVLRKSRNLFAGAVIAAAAAAIAGPLAYTVDTVGTPHSGAIPSAGPTVTGAMRGPGGMGGAVGFPGGGRAGTGTRPGGGTGGFPGGGGGAGTSNGTGAGGFPGTGSSGTGTGGFPGGGALPGSATGGSSTGAAPTGAGSATRRAGGGQGGQGGFLNSSDPGTAVVKLLEENSSSYTWVAATVGANSAAGYQLATDDPIMAIGGFNGTDPAPTLAEFEKYVSEHKIHWYIATSGAGSGGSGTVAGEITTWVEAHFKAQTVDGTTMYDLS